MLSHYSVPFYKPGSCKSRKRLLNLCKPTFKTMVMPDSGKLILGFALGLGVGAVTGLLLAPDKGSETYSKLEGAVKDVAEELKEYSTQKFDELKKRVG